MSLIFFFSNITPITRNDLKKCKAQNFFFHSSLKASSHNFKNFACIFGPHYIFHSLKFNTCTLKGAIHSEKRVWLPYNTTQTQQHNIKTITTRKMQTKFYWSQQIVVKKHLTHLTMASASNDQPTQLT